MNDEDWIWNLDHLQKIFSAQRTWIRSGDAVYFQLNFHYACVPTTSTDMKVYCLLYTSTNLIRGSCDAPMSKMYDDCCLTQGILNP